MTHAAGQQRPDVKAARIRWRQGQPLLDSQRLVFIDGTALNTKMAGVCGRAHSYPSAMCCQPTHGHWQRTTFIPALRAESIAAPFVIKGAINTEVFTA
jgi:hypothetical protein